MSSAFFVTLETRESFDVDQYLEAAGQISNALHATLGDLPKLRSISKSPDLANPRVEVEITQSTPTPSAPITARAVVHADGKWSFDKNAFTSMVRAELPFPVAVSKRMVPKEELPEEPNGISEDAA